MHSAGCSASSSNMLLVIEILVMREYNHLSYVVLRRNQFFYCKKLNGQDHIDTLCTRLPNNTNHVFYTIREVTSVFDVCRPVCERNQKGTTGAGLSHSTSKCMP